MRKKLYILLLILGVGKAFGQNRDFISSTYTFVPSRLNQVDFNQSRTVINLPFRTKIGLFSTSLNFDYYKFNYDQNLYSYTESLEQMYAANYRINYTRPISKNWQLGLNFMVGTQSNFDASLSSEDFNLGGGLFFVKVSSKDQSNSRLVVGVNFSNALGEPRLLPMIGYTKMYKNGNAFAIGFPNTFYRYQINKRNSLTALLDAQGFYMNIGDRPRFDQNSVISRAFFISLALGLEFRHRIDNNWGVSLKSSYAFINDYTLLNEAEEEIFDFGLSPVFYISTGLTFNINRKKNKLK